nr:tripartite tricarboxylate transporter TctB family protein [Propionivibrio soli]
MYSGFGGIAFVISRDYAFGSAGRMGPGYFPSVLSCLLIGFGILALARGMRKDGTAFGGFAWRKAAIVLAATAAFGFLLPRAGLIIALLVLIFGSATASTHFRFEWRATLLALALVAFCVLVFVTGLGLPMRLFGSWFGA